MMYFFPKSHLLSDAFRKVPGARKPLFVADVAPDIRLHRETIVQVPSSEGRAAVGEGKG